MPEVGEVDATQNGTAARAGPADLRREVVLLQTLTADLRRQALRIAGICCDLTVPEPPVAPDPPEPAASDVPAGPSRRAEPPAPVHDGSAQWRHPGVAEGEIRLVLSRRQLTTTIADLLADGAARHLSDVRLGLMARLGRLVPDASLTVALREMVASGEIRRVRHGVYART